MSSDLERVKHRVWITERCHMNAEKRNRRYELYFHLLLAFYSLSAIGYGIIANEQVNAIGDDDFLFLSVVTLTLSLLIFGFKFGETAAQHRACYLSLQKLRFEKHTAESLNGAYITAIGSLPNHTTNDFHRLVITNLLSKKQIQKDAYDNPYEFSHFERLKFTLSQLIIWISAALLFLPALLILLKAVNLEFAKI